MLRIAVRDFGQLLALLVGEILRQHDLDFGKQVACRLIGWMYAVPFDPQPFATGCIGRHFQRDRALRRWHIDGRALDGFGQRHWHAHIEPIAAAAKIRMRTHANREQDIAWGRIARPRLTLSAEPNFFAVVDADGNFYADRFELAVWRCTVRAASPPRTAVANGIVSSCRRSFPRAAGR